MNFLTKSYNSKSQLVKKHRKVVFLLLLLFLSMNINAQKSKCISGDCNNGYGTKAYHNETYTGNFKNYVKHGKGKIIWKNNRFRSYQGDFKEGKITGFGTMIYSNGDKYIGQIRVGYRNGKGTYISRSGSKYVGDFKNDIIEGKGMLTYPDGDKYTGEFKDNTLNGKGTYIYGNNSKYVGEFVDGNFHGYGTYYLEYGDVFHEGQFKNGEPIFNFSNNK